MEKHTIVKVLVFVLVLTLSSQAVLGQWWNTSFSNRIQITFNNSASSENLTNFTVLVKLNSTRIDYADTQDSGQDIRFIDDDGATLLSHEIEEWDEADNSFVWVKIPRIDVSSDTDYIWMYYNNPTAADGQDIPGTWDSHFVVVSHMAQSPAAGDVLDSTEQGNLSEAGGFVAGDFVDGRIGKAIEFDGGSTDYLFGRNISVPMVNTVEVYLNNTGTMSNENYFSFKDNNDPNYVLRFRDVSGDRFDLLSTWEDSGPVVGNWYTPAGSVLVDTIYYLASSINGSDPNYNPPMYIDGVNQTVTEASTPSGVLRNKSVNLTVGNARTGSGTEWIGVIDEFRLSDVIRSQDWIFATNRTLADGFNTYGSPESNQPTLAQSLVGRYWVQEDYQGNLSTILFDDQPSPQHMTIIHTLSNFTNASGRGLTFSGTGTQNRRVLGSNIAGTKYESNFFNKTKATIEYKISVSTSIALQGNIGGFVETSAETDGFFLKIEDDGTVEIRLSWANESGSGTTRVDWNAGTYTLDTNERVVHAVLDTTQATASDRIKLYINGTDQGAYDNLLGGSIPPLNSWLSGNGETIVPNALNRISDFARAWAGTFKYMAFYNSSLNTSQITSQVNSLFLLDDELPTVGSVLLNATTASNTTNDNLTAYALNAHNYTTIVNNWNLNGTSIAVLNMPFDTNPSSGTHIKEYSGYENNGTSSDVTWTSSGKLGGALDFNGADSFINVSDDSTLDISSQYTIEAWIYPNSYGEGSFGRIVQKGDSSSNRFVFYIDGTCPADCRTLVFTKDSTDYAGKDDLISVNSWSHVAVTYNGSNLTMYVNGTERNSFSPTDLQVNGDPLYIGNRATNDRTFDGLIDEVRIYNKSLSAEQIWSNYNGGVGRFNVTVSQETSIGDNWTVCQTPNDGFGDGDVVCSNVLTFLDSTPSVSSVLLNATSTSNTTSDNLTATAINPQNYDTLIWNWKMNDTSITVLNMPFDTNISSNTSEAIRDYSGYNNDGTLGGLNGNLTQLPTWTSSGISGGAYISDGINLDEIEIPDDPTLDFEAGETFTISFWMKSADNSSGRWVEKRTFGKGYIMSTNDAGMSLVVDDGGLSGVALTHEDNYDNNWHHIVAGRNETHYFIYLDGVLNNTATNDTLGDISNTDNVHIGHNDMNGSIDEVMIFNRSLTAEQVWMLYNSGAPKFDAIASTETNTGENWTACVTPNDDAQGDGTTVCSNNVTIQETTPSVDSVLLNATSIWNRTNDNLTAWAINPQNHDTLIWNWKMNDTSITVLNMPFDTNNATGVTDYSGFNLDGNVTGAAWNASGISGGAYTFDGSGDYINLSSPVALDDLPQQSICAWIYPVGWGNGNFGRIYAKGNTGTTFNLEANSGADSNQTFSMLINYQPTFVHRAAYNGSISLNTWSFVCGTWNGSLEAASIKLYLNGTLITNYSDEVNGSGSRFNDSNFDAHIGNRHTVDRAFNGTIDEFVIYNRTLTAEQIRMLYNSGTPKTDAIAYTETNTGENWTACVTPNDDAKGDGATICSNNITIQSTTPSVDSVLLNATTTSNTTSDNLTAHPQNPTSYDTLIYNWKMNDTSITVLNMPFDTNNATGTTDYSTFGNDGAIFGDTYWNATGISGGHYVFDGDGDYINISSDNTLNLRNNSDFSISLWIRPIAVTTDRYLLVNSETVTSSIILAIDWDDGSCPGSNEYATVILGSVNCTGVGATNDWTHIVLTVLEGGATDELKIYINGTEVMSTTGSVAAKDNQHWLVGIRYDLANGFNGSIDEVIFYNRTLTPEQITSLYNSGSPNYDDIVSQETNTGENWTACVTPNDDTQGDGTTICSNNITIQETTPSVDSVILNSTKNTNTTYDNLTAWAINPQNHDTLIYNWYINNTTPIMLVNFPFDTNYTTNDTDGLRDYSGSNNNGTLADGAQSLAPMWVSQGINGGAYLFDGNDDRIEIEHLNSEAQTPPFAIEAWFNNTGAGTDQDTIVGRSSGANYQILWLESFGNELEYRQTNESGNFISVATAGNWDDSQWHHVVVFVNTTHMAMYIDGVIGNLTAYVGEYTGAADWYVGVSRNDFDPFNGIIDEVRFYNRTLTEEQIIANYYSGLARYNFTVSQETQVGENWSVCVTPNAAQIGDGSTVCSNIVTIQDIAVDCSGTNVTQCSGNWCMEWHNTTEDRKVVIDYNGSMDIVGSLTPYSVESNAEFQIKNSSGTTVASINATSGDMHILGSLIHSKATACTEPSEGFIVRNATGDCVGYIDNDGDMWMKGQVCYNAAI